jgi:uncharacterized protein (DUF1499 family)
MLNDITTDTADPPRFETLARVRSRDANSVEYPGAKAAAAQADVYPDIEPYLVDVPPQIAFEAALASINKRRWRIVDERSPLPGRRDGHIEAVARSPIMGFRDDVVVRIRATPDGTQVDVRSASRYGPTDLGSNAARVRALLEGIDEAISARPRVAPPPAQTPAPAAAAKRGQAERR